MCTVRVGVTTSLNFYVIGQDNKQRQYSCKEVKTDRQAGGQASRETDRQTDRQAGRQAGSKKMKTNEESTKTHKTQLDALKLLHKVLYKNNIR